MQAHDAFFSSVAAKVAVDPETRNALDGFQKAAELGVHEDMMAFLGHAISDTANPHEVLLALGKTPDAIVMYSRLSLQHMTQAVHELARQLAAQKDNAPVKPPPKPAPPAPVGARATATAFDPNDDKLDPDEWMRQRNEQLAKSRRR